MRLTPWTAALALAAATTAQQPPPPPHPVETAPAAPSAVPGNNEFALDLYAVLRREPGNLFYAPFSVRTALAMTWAGARGTTATQMADVLCITGHGDAAHRALGDLARHLGRDDPEGGVTLHVANSLWGQEGEPFLPAFLDLCASRYDAGFGQLDFRADPDAARHTINDWVSARTDERIPELLKKDIIDASTVLVLTNAIDFRGTWRTQFDPAKTSDRPFWLLPAAPDADVPASVSVPTMQVTDTFAYHEDPTLQAIELPYAGDTLSMVVLLPRARDGITALEEQLDPATLEKWTRAMKPQRVALHLPRFTARRAFRLDSALQELGMTEAFGRGADFSGMNGKKGDLFIGAVVHEAFVEVDEEGTEAAAATAVVMKRGGPPHPVVRADHPFLFLIRDRRSGAIVFLGRIVDPGTGDGAR